MSPAVTVVIPAYKALRTVARAIDSALSQCGGQVAVIVVIDDQCEATRKLVDEHGDPRVRVLMNGENLGAPASRNRGLSLAISPYVAFLDADDFYQGGLLEPLIESMRSEDAEIGFGPNLMSTSTGYAGYSVPDYRNQDDMFERWFGGGEHVNTASVVWSTAYLRKIGGWDEELRRNQDGELALRAILLGAKFTQSSAGAGVWCHHAGESRISGRTDNLESLLAVVSKLGRTPSESVSEDVRRRATGAHLHNIALRAYRAGSDDVGDEAMRRRRSLGFADSDGTFVCRAAVSLRALPKRPRNAVWKSSATLLRMLKRLTGRSERPVHVSALAQSAIK